MVCYLFGFFGLMKFVYLLHNVHADCDNSCFEIAMDPDAGTGTSIDSFYEYLLKAYLLFGDEEYVEVNMDFAALVWPLFNSLHAFWPGLQPLAGDINPAICTDAAFLSVWRRYGFTPE
ncbi:Alpha-mannosidase I mns4 [Trifolium repens]|nr:Alpha-mannosidase I mns4 [Trifolium repens]WJX12797.1 Alpha-mannosidase I mns4 [Trifolium repens]